MAEAGQEEWKNKYLETIGQLEQQEKSSQLLRHGLSRIALVSQGIDEGLDKRLAKLRQAIQDNAGANLLHNIIEKISEYVKKMEDGREAQIAQIEPVEVLLQVVKTINFPASAQPQFKQYLKRLKHADASTPIDGLIDEFSTLIVDAFQGEENKQGWWQRLFGKKEQATTSSQQSSETMQARSKISEFHGQPDKAAPGIGVDNVLLELLESLSFPPEFNERLQKIKTEFISGVSQDKISGVAKRVIMLVVEMRTALEREKEELEIFLQQLIQRLQELDAMVEGAEMNRLASLAGGRQLTAAVNAQVDDIENTVQSEHDLTRLKTKIQGSLDKIRHHLAEQREQEETRQHALENQLMTMAQRLSAMESETEALHAKLEQERQQAMIDPLTGTANRLAYEQRIAQELARWQRYQTPLTLMVCDVDHFKKVNDTHGHQAGDRALMAIVKTIQKHLRETDFMARIGGEEFVVILPETPLGDAKTVAEKLRKSLEESEFAYEGKPVPITISGGLSQCKSGDTVDSIYQRTDQALYRAKRQGRNRFVSAV